MMNRFPNFACSLNVLRPYVEVQSMQRGIAARQRVDEMKAQRIANDADHALADAEAAVAAARVRAVAAKDSLRNSPLRQSSDSLGSAPASPFLPSSGRASHYQIYLLSA